MRTLAIPKLLIYPSLANMGKHGLYQSFSYNHLKKLYYSTSYPQAQYLWISVSMNTKPEDWRASQITSSLCWQFLVAAVLRSFSIHRIWHLWCVCWCVLWSEVPTWFSLTEVSCPNSVGSMTLDGTHLGRQQVGTMFWTGSRLDVQQHGWDRESR